MDRSVVTPFGQYLLSRIEGDMVATNSVQAIVSVGELGFEGAGYSRIIEAALSRDMRRFSLKNLRYLRENASIQRGEYIIVATEKVRGWAQGQWLLPALTATPAGCVLTAHSFFSRFRFAKHARFLFAA